MKIDDRKMDDANFDERLSAGIRYHSLFYRSTVQPIRNEMKFTFYLIIGNQIDFSQKK